MGTNLLPCCSRIVTGTAARTAGLERALNRGAPPGIALAVGLSASSSVLGAQQPESSDLLLLQCFRRLATSINEVSSLFPNWCKQGHPDSYHCGVPVVILCAPIFFKSRLGVSEYTFWMCPNSFATMGRKTLRGHDVGGPRTSVGAQQRAWSKGREREQKKKKQGRIPIPEARPPRPPQAVAPVTSIWAAPRLPHIPAAFEPLKEPLQIPASDIP